MAIKIFTYSELKPVYDKEPSPKAGIYLWMHEYCSQYLKDYPELEKVTLKMEGEDVGKLEGKVYEFEREVSHLRINKD